MIQITPALPDQEWERLENQNEARLPIRGGVRRTPLRDIAIWNYGTVEVERESLPALIAVANDSLHPDDPRRITRETVKMLKDYARDLTQMGGGRHGGELDQLASVLEAYLPPELFPGADDE